MKSPFSIFRKHQRTSMVILTGLAMFAFVLLGSINPSTGQLPQPLIIVTIVAGVSGAFWVIGTQTGKPKEYALAGAVLGAALAYAGFQMSREAPAVETSAGDISQLELQRMMQERQIANQFVNAAFERATPFPPPQLASILEGMEEAQRQRMMPQLRMRRQQRKRQFLFGQPSERSVVMKYLLLHEADEMGVTVPDQAVENYIKRVTQDKLSVRDFRKILDRLRLTETELYRILRQELQAQRAAQLSLSSHVATPEQYWELYKRLNVRQKLDVAAVPVDAFTSQVAEPSQAELAELFERYKNVFPSQAPPGKPAFGQPRKVRLAYLEADFESFQERIPEITDEEVRTFYEDNKETLYRNDPVSEASSGSPPRMDLSPSGPPPGDSAAATPRPSPGQGPALQVPATRGETSPDSEPEGDEEPAPSETESPETGETRPDSDGGSASLASPAAAFASVQDPLDDPESPERDDPAADGTSGGETTPARGPVAAPQGEPRSPAPVVAPRPQGQEPQRRPRPVEAPPAQPKFRPLDDDLRAQIREQLRRQRTNEAMQAVMKQAADLMVKLGQEYNVSGEEGVQTLTEKDLSDRLETFARENDLRYVVTEPLSRAELLNSEDHPIGGAREPNSGSSVVESLFASQPDQVYNAHRVEHRESGNRYAWWKIDDIEAHVPSLESPGVRDQVREAWKRIQARSLAEKRAEELVQLGQQNEGPMEDVLSRETVTGTGDGPSLTVHQTDNFSWLRESTAPSRQPFASSPPTLSQPEGIVNPGPGFMRTVFKELEVGETGVAANEDRSIYYVVRVVEREPSTPEQWAALREAFLQEDLFGGPRRAGATPYDSLRSRDQRELIRTWRDQLEAEYNVRWNRVEPPAA